MRKFPTVSGVMCDYTSYITISDQVYVENPQQEEENSCPVEGVEEIVESVSGRKHRRKRGTVSDDVFITPDGYTMKRRRSRRSKKGKNDEDNDSTNKTIEIDVEEIDMSKVWKNDCSVEDIIRFQSRDGFWDLSSLFVSRKCKGKLPEIPGIDFSESPMIKKKESFRLCSP